MVKRVMRHPVGPVCLAAAAVGLLFVLMPQVAEAQDFLRAIETKAGKIVDGVIAIAKVVLVIVLVFFGFQVAQGNRDAWGKAIATFVGVLLVFQAKNILTWLGS